MTTLQRGSSPGRKPGTTGDGLAENPTATQECVESFDSQPRRAPRAWSSAPARLLVRHATGSSFVAANLSHARGTSATAASQALLATDRVARGSEVVVRGRPGV